MQLAAFTPTFGLTRTAVPLPPEVDPEPPELPLPPLPPEVPEVPVTFCPSTTARPFFKTEVCRKQPEASAKRTSVPMWLLKLTLFPLTQPTVHRARHVPAEFIGRFRFEGTRAR